MAVVDPASPRGPAEKQPQILRRYASQDDNTGGLSFEGDWKYAGFVFEPGL
jgi:hypothetical protein